MTSVETTTQRHHVTRSGPSRVGTQPVLDATETASVASPDRSAATSSWADVDRKAADGKPAPENPKQRRRDLADLVNKLANVVYWRVNEASRHGDLLNLTRVEVTLWNLRLATTLNREYLDTAEGKTFEEGLIQRIKDELPEYARHLSFKLEGAYPHSKEIDGRVTLGLTVPLSVKVR